MRVLIAPDKFKGSLSAPEAAAAIRRGIRAAMPHAECIEMPIADGGEGTADVIAAACGGEWIEVPAHDPLGRKITARYLKLGDTAFIEMSAASGMWRVRKSERDPWRANTFGTGELMRDAQRRGSRRIFVGLGGSATNDAGAGMAEALGYVFLTSDGETLPARPENFLALIRIEPPDDLDLPSVIALCDVRNPLLGERGASRVYGPQKGANGEMASMLELALEHLAELCQADLGRDFAESPGAGAAGGLGFGLLTFCGGELRPGFETVAELTGLERHVAAADLVITGEGCIDGQTREGKAPAGIAELARRHAKPVFAFVGKIDCPETAAQLFDRAFSLTSAEIDEARAIRDANTLLEESVAAAITPASGPPSQGCDCRRREDGEHTHLRTE